MRIYLTRDVADMAALRAAVDVGFRDASVRYSSNLGYFVECQAVLPELEMALIAAVRTVDPTAGTSPQR
jgi:hypothetical protein